MEATGSAENDGHNLLEVLGELLLGKGALLLEQPIDEFESQPAEPTAMGDAQFVKRSLQNRAQAFCA